MKKFLDILKYAASVLVLVGSCGAAGYFWPVYFGFAVLTTALLTSLFYLWRFTRIIMVLENDLGGATQALEEVNQSMQSIIDMKLYFDTPEVQELVSGVMENVRMAQFSVNNMIGHFTDRSKQKFVMLVEDEPEPETHEVQPQREGTVGSVETRPTTAKN